MGKYDVHIWRANAEWTDDRCKRMEEIVAAGLYLVQEKEVERWVQSRSSVPVAMLLRMARDLIFFDQCPSDLRIEIKERNGK